MPGKRGGSRPRPKPLPTGFRRGSGGVAPNRPRKVKPRPKPKPVKLRPVFIPKPKPKKVRRPPPQRSVVFKKQPKPHKVRPVKPSVARRQQAQLARTRKAQRQAARVERKLPSNVAHRLARKRIRKEYGSVKLTPTGRKTLQRELRSMHKPTYAQMKRVIEKHRYKGTILGHEVKVAGFDVGRAIRESPGVGKRFTKGAEAAAVGFLPGVKETFQHPRRVAERTIKQVRHDLGPLAHGDFEKFAQQVSKDPFTYFMYGLPGIGITAKLRMIRKAKGMTPEEKRALRVRVVKAEDIKAGQAEHAARVKKARGGVEKSKEKARGLRSREGQTPAQRKQVRQAVREGAAARRAGTHAKAATARVAAKQRDYDAEIKQLLEDSDLPLAQVERRIAVLEKERRKATGQAKPVKPPVRAAKTKVPVKPVAKATAKAPEPAAKLPRHRWEVRDPDGNVIKRSNGSHIADNAANKWEIENPGRGRPTIVDTHKGAVPEPKPTPGRPLEEPRRRLKSLEDQWDALVDRYFQSKFGGDKLSVEEAAEQARRNKINGKIRKSATSGAVGRHRGQREMPTVKQERREQAEAMLLRELRDSDAPEAKAALARLDEIFALRREANPLPGEEPDVAPGRPEAPEALPEAFDVGQPPIKTLREAGTWPKARPRPEAPEAPAPPRNFHAEKIRAKRAKRAVALHAARRDIREQERGLREVLEEGPRAKITEAPFHRSPSALGSDIQGVVDAISEGRVIPQRLLTSKHRRVQRAAQGARRRLIEGPMVGAVGRVERQQKRIRKHEEAREIIRGGGRIEPDTTSGALGIYDTIQDVARTAYVYGNPAYIPRNVLGNVGFLALHHPEMLINPVKMHQMLKALRELNDLDKRNGAPEGMTHELLAHEVGEGSARALYTHSAKNVASRAMQKLPEFQGKYADKPFRKLAFTMEANKMGYRTGAELHELLTSRDKHVVADRQQIGMEARRAMVDFSKLQGWEKKVAARLIFLYPWIRRASAYGASLPMHKPGTTAVAAGIGTIGAESQEDFWKTIPPWMRGTIPLGKPSTPKTLHGEHAQWMLNPFAVDPLSTATQTIGDLARSAQQMQGGYNDLQAFLKPLSMLQPHIRLPIEMGANRSFYSGKSLQGRNLATYLKEQSELTPVPRLVQNWRSKPGTVLKGSYVVPGTWGKIAQTVFGSAAPAQRVVETLHGQRKGENIRREMLRSPTERVKRDKVRVTKAWRAAFKQAGIKMPQRLKTSFEIVYDREAIRARSVKTGASGEYVSTADDTIADLRTLRKYNAGPFASGNTHAKQMKLAGLERAIKEAKSRDLKRARRDMRDADWFALLDAADNEIQDWVRNFERSHRTKLPVPPYPRRVAD